MNNIIKIVDSDKCCGCGVCSGVCIKNAIEIEINSNGFYRPRINQASCIECGMCLKICPVYKVSTEVINDEKSNIFGKVLKIYSGWAKDENIRNRAASGGIATALSLEYLKMGYAIGGTSYSLKNLLRTISEITQNDEQVRRFSSSKYMPSEYSRIAKYIRNNPEQKVLVIGLPCQIAGIRNIIGNNPNVILVDIFCGRNMSYKLIELYTKEFGLDTVKYINFRDKRTTWYNYSLTISNENIEQSECFRDSIFGNFLINKIFTQSSCYDCSYGSAGVSDITLGDFWDKEKFGNEINGVSLIVARSTLGRNVLENSRDISIFEEDISYLKKTQPHFFLTKDSDSKERYRKTNIDLFSDLHTLSLKELDFKYNHISSNKRRTIRLHNMKNKLMRKFGIKTSSNNKVPGYRIEHNECLSTQDEISR